MRSINSRVVDSASSSQIPTDRNVSQILSSHRSLLLLDNLHLLLATRTDHVPSRPSPVHNDKVVGRDLHRLLQAFALMLHLGRVDESLVVALKGYGILITRLHICSLVSIQAQHPLRLCR